MLRLICVGLGCLFTGLKLAGQITWPWVWVTAPFWGYMVMILALFALTIFGIVGVVVAQESGKKKKK